MSNDDRPVARPGMRLCWRLLICLLFYGPALYFKLQGDSITSAIFAVAGIGAFSGYRAGAASMFAMLAGVSAAIALGPSLGIASENWIGQWLGTTGLTNRFASVVIVALLVAIIVTLVISRVARRVMSPRPRLAGANRWLGLSAGALQGTAAIVFFLGGMLVIEPTEQKRAKLRDENDSRGRLLSKFILSTCRQTRESHVGPMLVEYNPFSCIPQLNRIEEVQQSVAVLSNPAKIQGLLHHPKIRRLQRRPEVRRVVDELTSDPEIREILHSGGPIDRTQAMKLLSHPAVMELVDQPGFIEEASDVIQGTGVFGTSR